MVFIFQYEGMAQKSPEERRLYEQQEEQIKKERLKQEFSNTALAACLNLGNAYRQIVSAGSAQAPGVKINGQQAQGQEVSSSCTISVDIPVAPELSSSWEKNSLRGQLESYLRQTNPMAKIVATESGFTIIEELFMQGGKVANAQEQPAMQVPLREGIHGALLDGTKELLLVESIEYASSTARESLRAEQKISQKRQQDAADQMTKNLGEQYLVKAEEEQAPKTGVFEQAKKEFAGILQEIGNETSLSQKDVKRISMRYNKAIDNTDLVLAYPQEESPSLAKKMLEEAAKLLGIQKKNAALKKAQLEMAMLELQRKQSKEDEKAGRA